MDPADAEMVETLMLVKWIFGGLLALFAALIIGAAVMDVRERRRWRAMVPDGWPPAGELHEVEKKMGVLS